jgi:hypothetical protein
MSLRSDPKCMFSVLAISMLLAGGAVIASTEVGAQTVDRPPQVRRVPQKSIPTLATSACHQVPSKGALGR